MKIFNIYLHFLDRELRYSVNSIGREKDILEALLAALCLSSGKLFYSYSHLWENYPLLRESLDLLRDLTTAGLITPAAKHVTSDEFLASHTTLYSHDRKRYPMYFNTRLIRELGTIQPVHIIQRGATETLIKEFNSWIAKSSNARNPSEDRVKKIVEKTLNERRQEAVTGALFAPYTENDCDIKFIRRKISLKYASHYMVECAADILTGIPSLGFYDSLAICYPRYDVALFRTLLTLAEVNLNTETEYRRAIEEIASEISHPIHSRFISLWDMLLKSVVLENSHHLETASEKAELQGLYLSRMRQMGALKRPLHSNKFSVSYITSYLDAILSPTSKIVDAISAIDHSKKVSLRKLVFIVATNTESEALIECFRLKSINLLPQNLPRLSAWRGTALKGFEIWVIRTEMASTGQAGAALTTEDAISQLAPDFMIMPGIAFGLKPDKQNIGDILVAKSINDYETSKLVDGHVIPRGESPNSSSELLSKARMVASSWRTSQVHVGQILSGPKLVNDSAFVDELRHRYPEAIGGEMEGCGFAAACERHKIPWLLVKSICDWGIKKTDEAQPIAATHAVSFCMQVVALLPNADNDL